MHRSRLTGVLFDVPDEASAAETSFWSAALGRSPTPNEDGDDYEFLEGLFSGLQVMTQRIGAGASARVHVDIETDDVEAEVQRLERLGAVRVRAVESWWIMRDPAGLLFCVVRVQSPEEFARSALTWDDHVI
jgi:Glyoxalase-like domain